MYKSKIKLALAQLLEIKDKSDENSFKTELIKSFGIQKNEISKVWSRDGYFKNFEDLWLGYLRSKILLAQDDQLYTNLNNLKPLIEAIIEYLDNELIDMIKFTLYFIVDSFIDYDAFKISFLLQKIKKQQSPAKLKDIKSFKRLLSKVFRSILGDYKTAFSEFKATMGNSFDPLIRPILNPLDDIDMLIILFIEEYEAICSQLDTVRITIMDSYINFEKLAVLYNESEKDVEMHIDFNYVNWKELLVNHDMVLECLVEIRKYIHLGNYKLEYELSMEGSDFSTFLKMAFSKSVPINIEDPFNECEQILNYLLNDPSFRELFEDICRTKTVQSFYKYEKDIYFKNRAITEYYILLKSFELFWNRIKLIPLPVTIIGAATDMLMIYINSVQKKFEFITKENEEVKIKVLFNLTL
jgi:hypothetical protein